MDYNFMRCDWTRKFWFRTRLSINFFNGHKDQMIDWS